MTVGQIEKLFTNQRQWEEGDVGSRCLNENERREVFKKKEFVLQFFLGFLKINPLSRKRCSSPKACNFTNDNKKMKQFSNTITCLCAGPAAPMVPSCEILHTITPAAWTSNSLTSMSPSDFSNCLELIGHDPFLASYQRGQVLQKVKEVRSTSICLILGRFPSSVTGLTVYVSALSLLGSSPLDSTSLCEDTRTCFLLLPVRDRSAGWSSS